MYWSHPLDHSRARAVNPITKEAYFDIVEAAISGDGSPEEEIPPDLRYGADETGLQQGIGLSEQVIAAAGSSLQHQQQSGNCENITVLCTICADRTSLPPACIFKGMVYQSKWEQKNPLNASIGYTKKGYVDGEIGVLWIEIFNNMTREKANGRRWLLLVDGHVSHYTSGFLHYARQHNSTKVLMWLSLLYSNIDEYERRTGQPVQKEVFLEIYAQAHIKAFTHENILSAFRTTGIVPFNREVVTGAQMGPSLEHSMENELPVTQLLSKHLAVF
jgi:hypothetical protein